MKKLIFITFCVVLFSCKEKNIYCINTIKSSFESSAFVKSDMDKIKDLFNRNGFDYTKFLFTKIQYDGEYHIRGEQIVNNLLVFTSDVIFHFDENGDFKFLSGDLIDKINLNTKASMKEDDVVKMFINAVKEDGFYDAEFIINGCFNVEFGYYDLNASISFTDAKYVKAWKITSSFTEEVVAYINDEKSELIYYFNGIYID